MTSERRGAQVSTKQLVVTVLNDRRVTMRYLVAGVVELHGWIGGWDDFHWVVVDERADVHLVHKTTVTVKISKSDNTAMPDEVRQVVAGFKKWVQENYGRKTDGAS